MSNRETADDYYYVIAVLNGKWRVIDSMEPLPYRQWILQKSPGNGELNRWTTVSGAFCQTRSALIRNIEEKCGQTDPSEMTKINNLPNHIKES